MSTYILRFVEPAQSSPRLLSLDDPDILVESEDRTGEQERLRNVLQQSSRYIIDVNYLIRHQPDAAHYEQHRAGVLRAFETFVFHSDLFQINNNV